MSGPGQLVVVAPTGPTVDRRRSMLGLAIACLLLGTTCAGGSTIESTPVSFDDIREVSSIATSFVVGTVIEPSGFTAQAGSDGDEAYGYDRYRFLIESAMTPLADDERLQAGVIVEIGLEAYTDQFARSNPTEEAELMARVPGLELGQRIGLLGGFFWPQDSSLYTPVAGNYGALEVTGSDTFRWYASGRPEWGFEEFQLLIRDSLGRAPTGSPQATSPYGPAPPIAPLGGETIVSLP